jgi:hypothetical protein
MIFEKHSKCAVTKWWISEIQASVDSKFKKTIFCFFEEEGEDEDQITMTNVIIEAEKKALVYECKVSDTSFSEKTEVGKFSDYKHLGISQGHMVLAGENSICYVNLIAIIKLLM